MVSSGTSDPSGVDKDAAALRHLTEPGARAPVDDAAAVLDEMRHGLGETPSPDDAELVVVPHAEVGAAVLELCRGVNDLVGATRFTSTAEAFVESDRQNRAYLARTGARMTSYFDLPRMSTEVLRALVAAPDMPYYCSYVPLQMKVLGRSEVLLPGPFVDDDRARLLLLRRPEHLEAAWRYVDAVRRIAVSAADLPVN